VIVFLLPSIVKRPSATDSEYRGRGCRLRGHIPANHRPDKRAIVSRVFLPRNSRWFVPAVVEGWQGSGYRTRTAFGYAAQVSTPRVHFCTLFSIGRAIWFLAFVANRTTSIPEPRLPDTRIALRRPRHPFRAARAGRRIFAGVGSVRRVSVPITCYHVILVHMERGIRVPVPSRAMSSDKRVPATIADATCCCCSGHASPEGARMGRRICEFRFVVVSVPVARSDHCSYRCGYTTFLLVS
jgi:hypothetical protein